MTGAHPNSVPFVFTKSGQERIDWSDMPPESGRLSQPSTVHQEPKTRNLPDQKWPTTGWNNNKVSSRLSLPRETARARFIPGTRISSVEREHAPRYLSLLLNQIMGLPSSLLAIYCLCFVNNKKKSGLANPVQNIYCLFLANRVPKTRDNAFRTLTSPSTHLQLHPAALVCPL